MNNNYLEMSNFSVSRNSTEIISNVNMKVCAGEPAALIGPNGAGKSILFKSLIGDIQFKGEAIFHDKNGTNIKPRIGYVPQRLDFQGECPISVYDLLAASFSRFPVWLGSRVETKRQVETSLAAVGAEGLLSKRVADLSGGELQRVLLALAIRPVPDLLLLDEPFSAVDQNSLENFYKMVIELTKAQKITTILVSHDLDIVSRNIRQVFFLNKTILASGTPEEVFVNPAFRHTFKVWNAGKGYACD